MNLREITIIGFDADDTLWDNEIFYRNNEKAFAEIVKKYSLEKDPIDVLFKYEMQNLKLYGYGAKSFTLSMIETAISLSNNKISASEIEKIIALGKKLINQPINLLIDVQKVLKTLQERYKLILVTKGDLLDQERKLKKSGLEKYFHHIDIMSDKKQENYNKLMNHLEIEPQNFLMIGNSVKSDVMPVVNIGAFAIHVPYATTWKHEIVTEKINSERCTKVEKLIDILHFF